MIAVALLATIGCGPKSNTVQQSVSQESSAAPTSVPVELTFAEQLSQVLSGKSIAIRLTELPITVDQLEQLVMLKDKLLELQLDAGIIDDSSIEQLGGLSALEHLRLRESPITDAGISKLAPARLPNLKILNLPQAKLTAAGLEHLSTFPNLSQLRMGASALDDRGAEVLAGFAGLRSIHLIHPQFTDAALEHLAKSPKLASLYIDECHLSDSAWLALFKIKPSLHVHIDQHHHDRDPTSDH